MWESRGLYRVWWGTWRRRDQRGDPGVDGRIILRYIFMGVGFIVMDWFELAHYRDRWRALVNAVMNFRVP